MFIKLTSECIIDIDSITSIYRPSDTSEYRILFKNLGFKIISLEQYKQLIKTLENMDLISELQSTASFNPHPDYYKNPSPMGLPYFKILGIDPTEFTDCRSLILMGQEKFDWKFDICSAVKYLWRLGCKGTNPDITKDLLKTKQYLQWALENKTDRHSEGLRLRIENCIKEIEAELQECQSTPQRNPNY